MTRWMVGDKIEVASGVCWFSVHRKRQILSSSVHQHIKERQGAIRLIFYGKFNGRLDRVEVRQKIIHVPFLENAEAIVYIAHEYFGAVGKRPQRFLLDCLHREIRRCDRDGRTHCSATDLFEKLPFEGEVCAAKTKLEQTAQLFHSEVGSCGQGAVFFEGFAGCSNCKGNWDTGEEGHHVERHHGVTIAEMYLRGAFHEVASIFYMGRRVSDKGSQSPVKVTG